MAIWYLTEGTSGVERLATGLCAAMLARGHEVTVIAKKSDGNTASSAITLERTPDGANLTSLDVGTPEKYEAARTVVAGLGLDVVLSMFSGQEHMIFPWLLAGSGVPLVAAEAVSPDAVLQRRWNAYEYFGALTAADYIQVLLPPFRNSYPRSLRRRVEIIGNPTLPPQPIDWEARQVRTQRRLLAVGRYLDEHKRFSLLLRAWAILAPDFPQWSLAVVGDGPNRDVYQSLITALNIADRTSLPCWAIGAELDRWYSESDLFCMPSRHEGFGLVLGEAAAWGLPLVGMVSCTAARELIAPEAGALCSDDTPAGLAETLRPLLAAEPEARQAMGLAAQNFFRRYTPDTVYNQWEDLLRRAAQRRGRTRLDRIVRDQWTPQLLREAALDIVSRPEPWKSGSGPDGRSAPAVLAKLLSSHQTLEREHGLLERKYNLLMDDYRALAAKAGGLHGGIKKKRR